MASGRRRKSGGIVLTLHIEGVRETLTSLNKLPKDANDSLRKRSKELADKLAVKVRAAGVAEGGQAAIVAPTVKARRDRVPVIEAGGTKRIGRHRKPAHKLLFGSEFGMNRRTGWYAKPRFESSTARQYKPHLGRGSYWFFKTVEANEDQISMAWRKVANDIIDSFKRGA